MSYIDKQQHKNTKQAQKEILEPKKSQRATLFGWIIATLNQPGNPL